MASPGQPKNVLKPWKTILRCNPHQQKVDNVNKINFRLKLFIKITLSGVTQIRTGFLLSLVPLKFSSSCHAKATV